MASNATIIVGQNLQPICRENLDEFLKRVPMQASRAIKVKELIELLTQMPQEADVVDATAIITGAYLQGGGDVQLFREL